MAKASASRVHLLVDLRKPWDVERARAFFAACGPARYEGRGAAVTPEDHERWARAAEAAGWRHAFVWDVPFPRGLVRLGVAMRCEPFPLGGREPVPWKLVDPARWMRVDLSRLDFEDEATLPWLGDYLGRLARAVEPGFAFADVEGKLAANVATDPRGLTWPILLLAPDHVARIGRERVASAPALAREVAPETFLVALPAPTFGTRARALDAVAGTLGRRARS